MLAKRSSPWAVTPELFEGLSDSVCWDICQAAVRKSILAGCKIFGAGEDSIYLLVEGFAKVSSVDVDDNEVILWVNTPGQLIGSLTLAPHVTTAIAIQPSKVLVWSLHTFEMILERFPEIARIVTQIIARQTAELSNRMCEKSTAPVWFCLAATLIRLADHIGRRVNNHIEIDCTQEVLGQMIVTSVYNVNHHLCLWERQGLVARRRGVVVIKDMAALKKLCGSIR